MEFYESSTLFMVIFGIDVEEADGLYIPSARIFGYGADVVYPQAGAVVGLVCDAILRGVVSFVLLT